MKAIFLTLLLLAFSVEYLQQPLFAQGIKNPDDRVDSRIDNMRYWMQKAALGLTPYNPVVTIEPATFRGDHIAVRGVRTTNSPDIPVTSISSVTQSENSVFVDPGNANRLLNSNNSTTWTGTSAGTVFGAGYFQSQNAGIGWAGSPNGAGGTNNGDPAPAIGLNGRQYINYCSSPGGQWIAWSDNGTSWSTATITGNPGDVADKNHMWIDNKSSSPYAGNLYVAWTDFGGADDTEIKTAHSANNGVSWSTPLKLSAAVNAGSHNQGVNIQTGPAGEVYVCWSVYDGWPSDEKAIGFTRSLDGGATYQAATRVLGNIKGIRYSGVAKNHRVNSFPVMAVDISGGAHDGNIYIVWTNSGAPGVNNGTNKSIYLIRSSNGGASWSAPVRVNQGPNVAGREAYFPWISCDPETGILSVIFYDDRNVTSTQCEVFVAYSTDAGNNWTDFPVSDVSFTPAPIPGLAAGYMGDYLGITSSGGKVYPCWTDNRTGSYMTWVSPFEIGLNAGFAISNTTPCTGSSVTFSDVSSGSPTSWLWSFPGGTPSAFNGKNPPAITYSLPGNYTVTLTVSDGVVTDTLAKPGYVIVKNVMAGFSASPLSLEVNSAVTFNNLSSCSPQGWAWLFPGGTPSAYNGMIPPPVIYKTPGNFNVTLTVTKGGDSDTRTETALITVTPTIFLMSDSVVTTCLGDFCDSGGLSESYSNDEIFTKTIFPATPGTMLRANFTMFDIEMEFDTLAIYDGIDTSAPLIGYYHGTAGPGIVTASNPAGALTFHFISDFIISAPGWIATLSCINPVIPAVRSIGNIQVSGSLCFDALQTVLVAGNGEDFTVQPGGSTMMIAGVNLLFKPGTIVHQGGYLHGFITPAGPFCIPPGSNLAISENQNKDMPDQSSFFRIYPNPTGGEFTLELNGNTPFCPVVVTIYDMKGIKILSYRMTNQRHEKFSLAGSAAGIYLVRVNSGVGYGMSKVILTD